jgi:acetyl esterase/lipase
MGWRSLLAVAGVVNGLKTLSPPGAITQHSYGSHPDERLELIAPNPSAPRRAPVVYLHGGGWICGKKEMFTGGLFFLAEAGHPVINIEYPKAPEQPHPHMLRSLLRALNWIHKQHPEHEAIHLMGDSAGGNLAVMLAILTANRELIPAIDPDFTAATPHPRSVISLYGLFERFSLIEKGFPTAAVLLESYAGVDALTLEGPATAITPMDFPEFAAMPPILITAGSADPLAESSRLGFEHLRQRFDKVEHIIYEGEGHGFFESQGRPACIRMKADILEFLAKH